MSEQQKEWYCPNCGNHSPQSDCDTCQLVLAMQSKLAALRKVAVKTTFYINRLNSDDDNKLDALDDLELIEEIEEALRASGYLEGAV